MGIPPAQETIGRIVLARPGRHEKHPKWEVGGAGGGGRKLSPSAPALNLNLTARQAGEIKEKYQTIKVGLRSIKN
jgi:hypothetical protein